MYSATVYLAFDPAQAADAMGVFDRELFPAVKAALGFPSGHWIEAIDNRSMGLLVFDIEEQVSAARAPSVGRRQEKALSCPCSATVRT